MNNHTIISQQKNMNRSHWFAAGKYLKATKMTIIANQEVMTDFLYFLWKMTGPAHSQFWTTEVQHCFWNIGLSHSQCTLRKCSTISINSSMKIFPSKWIKVSIWFLILMWLYSLLKLMKSGDSFLLTWKKLLAIYSFSSFDCFWK